MPMYEYRCDECQAVSELLRTMKQADDAAACESCGSQKTRRVQSVFQACASAGGGQGAGSSHVHSGGCCGGGCGMA